MKLAINITMSIVIALLLFLGVSVTWLCITAQGLQFTVKYLNKFAASTIHIGKASGRLIGPLAIDDFSFTNQSADIKIKEIKFNWVPRHLFFDTLTVKQLYIKDASIKTYAQQSKSSGSLSLPFYVALQNVQLQNIKVQTPSLSEPIEAENIKLHGEFTPAANTIKVELQNTWQNISVPLKNKNMLHSKNGSAIIGGTLQDFRYNIKALFNGNNFTDSQVNINGYGDFKKSTFTADLQQPKQHLAIRGFIKWQPFIAWRLNIIGKVDSSKIIPSWPGHINLNIDSAGKLQKNHVTVKLNIKKLQGQLRGETLFGSGYLNINSTQQTSITLPFNTQLQFRYGKTKLNLSGNQNHYTINFNSVWQKQYFESTIKGYQQPGVWHATLEKFSLQSKKYGDWHLLKAVKMLLRQQGFDIAPVHLQSGAQRISIAADITSAEQYAISLKLHYFGLQEFANMLDSKVHVSGHINGNFQAIHVPNQKPVIQGRLQISPGKLTLPLHEKMVTQSFNGGSIAIENPKQGLRASINFQFNPAHGIHGEINLPGYHGQALPPSQQKVNGNIKLNLTELSILSLWIHDINNTQGQLTIALNINGQLYRPKLFGRIRLQNASTEFPQYGIKLTRFNLRGHTTSNGGLKYTGSAYSGKGKAIIRGSSRFTNQGFTTEVKLTAKNFTAYDTKEYHITIEPNLTFRYGNNKMILDGSILIPSAKIAPADFSTTDTTTNDVVYVSNGNVLQEKNSAFYGNIKLDLGKNANINTQGLTGKLKGNLTLMLSPNRPTSAQGTLNVVDGKFKVLGQTLKISRGEIMFTGGNINNPGINASATRRIQILAPLRTSFSNNIADTGNISNPMQFSNATTYVTVGIEIQGRLKNRKVHLFSNPAGLSQGDILSLLLTGKSLATASGGDTSLLLQAASALNPDGATGAISRIQDDIKNTLGLDEFGISTAQQYNPRTGAIESGTALVVGKYLLPKLYVNYSVGLFSPINTLHVTYKIWKGLSLQSEASGFDSGVDLFYTFQSE